MNLNQDEAHLAVQNARDALHNNRRGDARQWAERAASLAPEMEDPWLILAAIADPHTSLEYIQKALDLNPNSPRARKGMEWVMQRLQSEAGPKAETADLRQNLLGKLPPATSQPAPAAAGRPAPKRQNRPVLPIILVGIGALVCIVAGFSALRSPLVASILPQAEPTHGPSWALVEIPKPTFAPEAPLVFNAQPTAAIDVSPTPAEETGGDSASATDQPTDMPTDLPTEMATGQAAEELPTAEPTGSGSLSMTYVEDTPTVEGALPAATNVPGYSAGGGEHWIDVNLTQQMVYAYEGNNVMNSFLVSTGTWLHPTVTGKYHIYVKLRYTDMSGADYYLPNVPYTMYFFQGYGLHGTYWHHNFGTPMSHGCVNLSIPDAQWLYSFASVGTLVNVHY